MSERTGTVAADVGWTHEILGDHAKQTRRVGIGLILLGIAAVLLPGIFTIGFELLIGGLLLVGGVLQIANWLRPAKRAGAVLPLMGGILSVIVGALFLANPFQGAAVLTVLLAALFLINGVFRIIHGLQLRGVPGTGWGILNGLLGVLIAILVWSSWPTAAEWFVGLLLGLDFLILGIFLVSFASAGRGRERA